MKSNDAQLILEIKAYLDENLYTAHSIQELCRRFNINREKLQTGFHKLLQSTVHAYIVRQRIDHAAQRLLTTDDSIKAIALESGYKKQRSFNKTFKAIYHLTPASYRRLHQQHQASKN
jgi:AraC family transcriptional regulator